MEQKKFKIVESKKTRYILPNILTLAGVCLGISSIKFSLDLNFIAPSNLGDELLGTVEIQKVTNSMVFMNCKLKCKNKLIASAVGIWKILRRPLPNAGLGG